MVLFQVRTIGSGLSRRLRAGFALGKGRGMWAAMDCAQRSAHRASDGELTAASVTGAEQFLIDFPKTVCGGNQHNDSNSCRAQVLLIAQILVCGEE
jgi:hypothetical protein